MNTLVGLKMSGRSHRGQYADAASDQQNIGNTLGDRSCVRQSKYFRQYESGNGMKSLLGSSNLGWSTTEKEGAFKGQPVYDFDYCGKLASSGLGRGEGYDDLGRPKPRLKVYADPVRAPEGPAEPSSSDTRLPRLNTNLTNFSGSSLSAPESNVAFEKILPSNRQVVAVHPVAVDEKRQLSRFMASGSSVTGHRGASFKDGNSSMRDVLQVTDYERPSFPRLPSDRRLIAGI
jgi:hypothetical protein